MLKAPWLMIPMRLRKLEVWTLHEPDPSRRSRPKGGPLCSNAPVGKKIRALRQTQGVPRDLGCYVRLGRFTPMRMGLRRDLDLLAGGSAGPVGRRRSGPEMESHRSLRDTRGAH